MSHLEKLCENHCHLHQNHEQKVKIKQHQVKSQEESHSFRKPSIRPSMDWKNKSSRKLPIPIMVPPPPKVISIHPSKLYKNLEAENSNSTGFNHEISPCIAGRRIHKLIENLQFVEGANFIHKLSHSTFKQMIEDEFSFQKLISFIPNSLPVVEAIYSKMFVNSRNEEPINLENLHPQEIVFSLINLFVPNNIPTELESELNYNQKQQFSPSMREKILDQSCILSAKRILKVIMLFDKRIRKQIDLKKRKVDRVIRGLGQHGLVGSNHDTLIDLHDAIRIELERVGNQYRTVVQKMNEISDHANAKTSRQVSSSKSCISKGPAPIESSHQRQLSLKLKDVQERLVKNCRLLNMIEITIGTNGTLQILLDNLRNRIEMDKEAISQVIQVGKLQCNKKTPPCIGQEGRGQEGRGQEGRIARGGEQHNPSLDNVVIDPETVLAPILIKYSTAYSKVFFLLLLFSLLSLHLNFFEYISMRI